MLPQQQRWKAAVGHCPAASFAVPSPGCHRVAAAAVATRVLHGWVLLLLLLSLLPCRHHRPALRPSCPTLAASVAALALLTAGGRGGALPH